MSVFGWRPEDDADLPEGWTWSRDCAGCDGPMPTDEPNERFCSQHCEDSFNGKYDDDDEAVEW